MKAHSKRGAQRLQRILVYAIPEVEEALQEGKISIDNAEIISRYSPAVQDLMLPETLARQRRRSPEKKIITLPALAEKEAADKAALEKIEEHMRFEAT